MSRKQLYEHIISTDWRGINSKIKQFKKKKHNDRKRNE